MKKVKRCLAGISFMCVFFIPVADSAEVNSGGVYVKEIQAQYAANSKSEQYRYTFEGRLGNSCGIPGKRWAVSGDGNVNKVLQMAYITGAELLVGIEGYHCVITVAQIK